MASRVQRATQTAKAVVEHLWKTDAELVEGGCADVSEIVARALVIEGFEARPVSGTVSDGEGGRIEHVWVSVEGEQLDPVLWVQGLQRGIKPVSPRRAPVSLCTLLSDEDIDERAQEALHAVGARS